MHTSSIIASVTFVFAMTTAVNAQISLTGNAYDQNFNSLASGLPAGWSVSTGATGTTLGSSALFNTDATSWSASRDTGGVFRNSSSSNISSSSLSSTQASNSDRALGWRPSLAGERDGAITVEFADTLGLENFTVSLTVFTFNDVTASASYDFEYRVGATGAFEKLGTSYATGAPFNAATLSFSSSTLSLLNDQAEPVYFRLRGTGSGTGSLDGVAIDNFSLSYTTTVAAMPEPASAATASALAAVGFAALRRRRR